ncbi:hypothetical protein [Reyranella sp.]|uniref:hypothetical protein n=1 Tax=Reyranella sp. TaxID=1929291 RepID=UPI003D123B8E
MADLSRAADGYEAYFTEKLWALVPAIYRNLDGSGEQKGVVRGLIETIASQAAILRRDQDRLWDDNFIDLCDDWAVPYIGELVGTRMISALDKRGRRIDVAKTIYYRRRKGTPRVLAELIADITPWDGTVVEAFRRLGRAHHGLDELPAVQLGRFSRTPRGGTADLRRPLASTLTDGPFDEYSHVADVRRRHGRDGLWNIPKLLFFLHRLRAFPVVGSTPFGRGAAGTFLFDPSGRDIALFAPRRVVPDWEAWRFPLPWDLPGPIACRLLGDAEYVVTQALILSLGAVLTAAGQPSAAANDLVVLRDFRFSSESALLARIATLPSQASLLLPPVMRAILDGALVADCGKAGLLPAAAKVDVGGTAIPVALTTSGSLDDWSNAPPNKQLVIDPERGRLKLMAGAPAAPVTVDYHYGFSGPVGAGTDDRRAALIDVTTLPTFVRLNAGGAIMLADLPVSGGLSLDNSLRYGPVASVSSVQSLVVQADNLQRPYVRLAAPWRVTAAAGGDATLVLDGLWIGGDVGTRIELAGSWKSVTLRRMTLDPGGTDANGNAIAAVPLVVTGNVENLTVEGSILASIGISDSGVIDSLYVSDSILQAPTGQPTVAFVPGTATLRRVTVLGDLALDKLFATETLVTGEVMVADTQWGCFRFSAALAGSRLPHPFASTELAVGAHVLASTRFGDADYCQIGDAAAPGIRRGAESGSEIGAFSSLNSPIMLDGITAKVTEYMPFGLIPAFIFET